MEATLTNKQMHQTEWGKGVQLASVGNLDYPTVMLFVRHQGGSCLTHHGLR